MPMPTCVEEVDLGRLHRPDSGGEFAGLVFVHDVWGPSAHSVALAADLASEGFGVLEIDLYRGLSGAPFDDPGERIRSLSDPAVITDLEAAADWLTRSSTVCRGRRVGIVGVCMGGTYAFLAACLSDSFAAAAPFYGILSYDTGMVAGPDGRDHRNKPTSPIEAGPHLRAPLLASFGQEDSFVSGEDLEALDEALAKSGVAFELDHYAGAGHAFLNRTRPDAYREAASHAAWERVVPFLHAELSR